MIDYILNHTQNTVIQKFHTKIGQGKLCIKSQIYTFLKSLHNSIHANPRPPHERIEYAFYYTQYIRRDMYTGQISSLRCPPSEKSVVSLHMYYPEKARQLTWIEGESIIVKRGRFTFWQLCIFCSHGEVIEIWIYSSLVFFSI